MKKIIKIMSAIIEIKDTINKNKKYWFSEKILK